MIFLRICCGDRALRSIARGDDDEFRQRQREKQPTDAGQDDRQRARDDQPNITTERKFWGTRRDPRRINLLACLVAKGACLLDACLLARLLPCLLVAYMHMHANLLADPHANLHANLLANLHANSLACAY